MSQFEISRQTLARLPKIKAGLIDHKTTSEIASECSVSRKTISRDIHSWLLTPDFEVWLKEAWLSEYVKASKKEAFHWLTILLGKMVTRKVETKTEVTEKVDVNVNIRALLERYEEVIERASNRNLPKDDSREQVDTAHPNATAN